jgi:3-carboxy-cis,cis-muconate cycloisomerase
VAGSLPARTLVRPSFDAAFDAPAFLAAMLAFEAALARAQADEGLIPAASAEAIARAGDAFDCDVEAFVAEGKRNATLAVPLARLLKAQVATIAPDAVKHTHFGATSQDVLDTAMALCLRGCLEEADRALEAAVRGLAAKARAHRATPMMGRTLMQSALPITAGLRIARWAQALADDRDRLAEAAQVALAVQLGGPVGALEAMGSRGPAVRHRMALALGLADVPAWHSHRGAWLDLLARIAATIATIGKVARDVALASQAEIGEMREAAASDDAGRSSAMPHKRNPVGCAHALAAAVRAPGLLATIHACALAEHERALGGWQAELATVPELAGCLGSALDFIEPLGTSLVVDAGRMAANIAAVQADAAAAQAALPATDEALAALSRYLS